MTEILKKEEEDEEKQQAHTRMKHMMRSVHSPKREPIFTARPVEEHSY
jgi:hypothetical protein